MGVPQQIQCPACGVTLRAGTVPAGKSVRCPKCSHKFRVGESSRPTSDAPAPRPTAPKSTLLLVAVVAFLVVGAVAAGIYLLGSGKPANQAISDLGVGGATNGGGGHADGSSNRAGPGDTGSGTGGTGDKVVTGKPVDFGRPGPPRRPQARSDHRPRIFAGRYPPCLDDGRR